MSNENEFLRLRDEINEAATILSQASRRAYQCSGDNPGMQADPFWGIKEIPPSEGCPALLALCDQLGKLAEQVAAIITPELQESFKAAEDHLDHLSDLADGASY